MAFPLPYVIVVSDGRAVRTVHPAGLGEHREALETVLCKLGLLATPPVVERPTTSPVPPPKHDGGGHIHEQGPTALGGPADVMRAKSLASGFTGDACPSCGNFTMRRTGTCVTCSSCGHNGGCG